MAYVPGYKHDIFVSYATADDQHGWVTEFVNELTIQLDALLGRTGACDVWWDRADLDEAARLSEQFKAVLKDTAILVAVLSKAYDASPARPA